MNLTNRDVEEILRLLEATTYDELRIETDSLKLVLRRSGRTESVSCDDRAIAASSAPAQGDGAAVAADPASAATDAGIVDVHAPLLGTFYRAPKPGAAPFVEIGTRVGPQTIVCIVEVMKLMTSVPAGVAGEVVEVLCADGDLVEYGQAVVRIRPDRS